jgi:hypothetical protein
VEVEGVERVRFLLLEMVETEQMRLATAQVVGVGERLLETMVGMVAMEHPESWL